jgi:hypothetical protein
VPTAYWSAPDEEAPVDVSTFYALFSATCFTLTGLWWGVVERHREWVTEQAMRRRVGSVYAAFLLPALMGLFAQVGGAETPGFWRVSFVLLAAVGCFGTVRLLRASRNDPDAGAVARFWWVSVVVYAVIAVIGVAPEIARSVGVTPLQAEATLLILLVALAHALVWEFMTREAGPEPS